jgi:hypothetical protein
MKKRILLTKKLLQKQKALILSINNSLKIFQKKLIMNKNKE